MTVESRPPGLSDSIHKMLKDIKAAVTKLEFDMIELKRNGIKFRSLEPETVDIDLDSIRDIVRDEIREALGIDE